jgi:hypothetical protein
MLARGQRALPGKGGPERRFIGDFFIYRPLGLKPVKNAESLKYLSRWSTRISGSKTDPEAARAQATASLPDKNTFLLLFERSI